MEPWLDGAEPADKTAWVKKYIESKPIDIDEVDNITPIDAGFMSQAFKVVTKSGMIYCFQRSGAVKHRHWAFENQAAAEGLAPKPVFQAYDPSYTSVEILEWCNGGQLLDYKVYIGMKEGALPSKEMTFKVGALLARLHRLDTAWHRDFASKAAFEAADIPLATQNQLVPNYDDEDPLPKVMKRLFGFLPPDKYPTGFDFSAFVKDVMQWKDHPILPKDGWSTKQVSMHGDFHGANIMIHDGEPLAIDFECGQIGPAGYDLGHIYQFLRGLKDMHDYEVVFQLCKGYLSMANGGAPSDEEVDHCIFVTMCWYYLAEAKQAFCCHIVMAFGVTPSPEKLEYANKFLTSMDKFTDTMLRAKDDAVLREKIVKTGCVFME